MCLFRCADKMAGMLWGGREKKMNLNIKPSPNWLKRIECIRFFSQLHACMRENTSVSVCCVNIFCLFTFDHFSHLENMARCIFFLHMFRPASFSLLAIWWRVNCICPSTVFTTNAIPNVPGHTFMTSLIGGCAKKMANFSSNSRSDV